MVAMTIYGLKELLMHVPEPTGYQAFVGLLRNLKSVVFSIKDGRSLTKGRRMWSTNPDILSVGQRLVLTMGDQVGGLVGLWILGCRYNCGVLGLSKTK